VGGYTAKTFLDRLLARGLDMDPSDSVGFEHETDPERRNVYKTFALSMKMFVSQVGTTEAERFSKGLRALGLAPPAGVGRVLGSAMAGLSDVDFSGVLDAALRLSLLTKEVRDEHERFVMHPLLARWMCRGVDEAEVVTRMGAFFEGRLPKEKQGLAWIEVNREAAALDVWLSRVQGEAMVRAERAGSSYAVNNGPFAVWMQFCERALKQRTDPIERSELLFILAQGALRMGDLDRALDAAFEKEATDRARGDDREAAIAAVCRADIFFQRGKFDEALRIYREDALPVFERIGDELSSAVTLGQIADILYDRGNLDEALRIRQQDVLPVFEHTGDEESRAVCLGKIADILFKRGNLDEALRIYQEDALPVHERLGDEHALLFGRSWVAIYLLARNAPGDRDEATRLLQLAHAVAVRMGIPEAETIRALQTKHGLPLE
jgi:tetratricopeptide (TPR) repeat protein